jgi:hypothetical protein
MSSLLPIALRFATQGIVAVPTASDGSKRPMLPTWKEFQQRLPTQDELLGWFNNETIQGLGVITGRISGNLEMLELEGRAVADKMHLQIAEIATSSGLADVWEKINAGYVEMTPSGGLHWLYRLESPVAGNLKLARRPGENGGVEVLAETRGEGGFSICAPSAGTTHPSGGAWQLLRGSIEQIPTLTDAEHTALHSLFALFDQMPKAESIAQEVSNKIDGILSAGDDYNARTTWDEILIPLGWSKVYNKGEATVWRRPGKNEGISATTNFNGNNKLFVFSTSTVFDSETSYSKFAAYAHLHHHGNFKNAAADLKAQGYGHTRELGVLEVSNAPLIAPEKPSEAILSEDESSWKPLPLSDYYDGLFAPPIATILNRNDGAGLIYQGRVHSFYGESESGKSWVAQIATAELLKDDKKVIYIDFESDALDIVNRLKSLGVSRANLLQYFTYIRPEAARNADDPYWQAILEPESATLVVIDGVTESLTMWGGETVDNDSITRWMRIFPRTVASASGAAVVLIDHITKNSETRGRFAIGGQAKLATIDGAAFLVEPIEVLSPGRVGSLTLRVTKDRPGFVRKSAGAWRKSDRTQESAVIVIDSTKAQIQYLIGKPADEDELNEKMIFKKYLEMAEFIHNHPGCNRRELNDGVKGDKVAIGERLDVLIRDGFVQNAGNGQKSVLYLTNSGKEKYDLIDAQITYLGEIK